MRWYKTKKIAHYSLLLITIVVLNGCATSSVFTPYPMQIAKIKNQIEKNSFDKALEQLNKEREGSDKTLYMLERARLLQLEGDFDKSITDFNLAMENEEVIEADFSDTGKIKLM